MYRLLIAMLMGFAMVSAQTIVTKTITIDEDDNDRTVKIQTMKSDSTVRLIIDRDGKVEELEIPFGEHLDHDIQEKLAEFDIDMDHFAFARNEFAHQMNGAWLGVQIQDLTDQLRKYFNVKHDGGVLVSEVIDDSPAAKAGFKAGDIIMKIDETNISDAGELSRVVRDYEPETKVEVQYIRSGKTKKMFVTLGERKSGGKKSWFGEGDFDYKFPKDHKFKKFRYHHDDDKKCFDESDDDLSKEIDQLKKELQELKESLKK